MSLQFYFGPSGSGKSKKLHEDIVAMAAKSPECNFLFLVPDQFTMQTQVDLVKSSPDGGIMNIDVLSFGRLTHRIFEETGFGNCQVLDDTGKSLVLRKVASARKEELPALGKNLNKIGYIHEVKSAISEFKQYGLTVEQVEELAEYAKGHGTLFDKLIDLKLLYREFDNYIADRFLTTEDTLGLLAVAVHHSNIIKNSVIVFDGFTGFTPIQYRLIGELMTLTKKVIVSITLGLDENPYKISGEQELFYLSKKTVRDLQNNAQRLGVSKSDDIFLGRTGLPRFEKSRELSHLEKHLFRYPVVPFTDQAEHDLTIQQYLNPAMEVRETCIAIRRLVLEENYCYRDIAVVTGNLESYGDDFEREAVNYDIPVFVDRTRGLLLNPFLEYIRSALRIVSTGFSYDAVFHYLRSGLSGFSMEAVDELENYVLATGIRGKKKWQQRFARNASEEIDASRAYLIEQLAQLLESHETAGEWVHALYEFIVKGHIQEKLVVWEEEFSRQGKPELAKEYAQIYRLVMDLLDQVDGLLGNEKMSLTEFAEILDAGFAEIEVGIIPGSVDRVIVGDIERSRLNQVKVLFFLGVNDGNIPKGASKGGILSDLDREFLQESPFELSPTPRQQMFTQRLYLYMNMTKPSKALHLSYARVSSDGKTLRPSYLIPLVNKLFPNTPIRQSEGEVFQIIQGKKDGFLYVAEEVRNYAQGIKGRVPEQVLFDLCEIYWKDAAYQKKLQEVIDAAFYRYEHQALGREVAEMLYGVMLENSVSRLERYASCAYAHFMEYGLSLQERQEFQFEAVDLGNIYHEVLKEFSNLLKKNGYSWFDFPVEPGEKLLWDALEKCALQYGETILHSSSRYEYMIHRIYRILKRTVWALKEQLRGGRFVPESFELAFSQVDDLDAVNIALSPKEKMKLRGKIDRVDTYEDENHVYVKVIDYKSGNKKFHLAAVYYGLQLQLVVYMNVAAQIEARKHPEKEIVPAALLYYHVNDPLLKTQDELSMEEVNEKLLCEFRMNGLVNESEEVLSLLDTDFEGKSAIIPVERKTDGSLSARSSVMNREDYDVISRYVSHLIHRFGREILEGNVAINPCRQEERDACTYCKFQQVCEYDGRLPGFHKRVPGDGMEVLDSREDILEKMKKELLKET